MLHHPVGHRSISDGISIAYGIGHANGAGGLEGFRWLFIIEGIITVISAVPLWLCLPDYPARAKWLNEDDKRFAEDRLKEHGGGYNRNHATKAEWMATAFSPRMLAHYFAYIADVVPQGSFTFFTPTIVTGLGYESVHAQLLTVPPWAVGFAVAICLSYSADRFDARGWHITVASTVGGIGWLTAGLLPHDAYVSRYGCLCLAACGAFPCAPSLTNWVYVFSLLGELHHTSFVCFDSLFYKADHPTVPATRPHFSPSPSQSP